MDLFSFSLPSILLLSKSLFKIDKKACSCRKCASRRRFHYGTIQRNDIAIPSTHRRVDDDKNCRTSGDRRCSLYGFRTACFSFRAVGCSRTTFCFYFSVTASSLLSSSSCLHREIRFVVHFFFSANQSISFTFFYFFLFFAFLPSSYRMYLKVSLVEYYIGKGF